jgi:hypothetical protein
MNLFLITLAILGIFANGSYAANGIDVSMATCQGMSSSDWQCLASNGITFAVVQVWV